jgi:hypothetical protein
MESLYIWPDNYQALSNLSVAQYHLPILRGQIFMCISFPCPLLYFMNYHLAHLLFHLFTGSLQA